MDIPITQSDEWAKLQQDLDERYHQRTGKDYHFLAIEKHTPVGKYLYCPYGPVASDEKSLEHALKELRNIARELNALFIRIEPTDAHFSKYLPEAAKSLRLKLVKTKDLNPKETWLLDLVGTEDELNSKLPSRLLRYYKSASKKGITIEKSHNPADIHYLLELQRALASEKGINTFSEQYLATELQQPFATLYLVWYDQTKTVTNGDTWAGDGPGGGPPLSVSEMGEEKARQDPPRSKVIAAGLVFDDETTRYNLQGAQSDEGRKLHATGILTIQLILDAYHKGLKTFDFWGIAPEGAPDTHPWSGFTNFKKTFAGYQKNHAGTYDLVLHPTKYKLYQLLRNMRRKI